MRPAIWVGDLVRARTALELADEASLASTRALLGLSAVGPRLPDAPQFHDSSSGPGRVLRPRRTEEQRQPRNEPDRAEKRQLTVRRGRVSPAPRRILTGPRLPVRVPTAVDHEALFDPRTEAALVAAAVSTTCADDGPPRIDELVETIARAEVVMEIPREEVLTLRRGVQVLVDVSPGQAPYAQDGAHLLRRIRSLVPADALELLYFSDEPRLVGPRVVPPWRTWRPPAGGAPVLVISNLGARHPEEVAVERWTAFGRQARRERCAVVALVPAARGGWPERLERWLTILPWDRRTTVSELLRLVRSA